MKAYAIGYGRQKLCQGSGLPEVAESENSAEAGDNDAAGAGASYRGPASLNSLRFLRSVNEGSGFIKERFFKRVLEQLQSWVGE